MRKRINNALADINMSKIELAHLLGVEGQHLNNWITRESIPKKHIDKIEKVLNRKVKYLELGVLPKYAHDKNTTPRSVKNKQFGNVPLISWINAGAYEPATIGEYNINKEIECHVKHGKNSYALTVNGSSMTAPPGSRFTFPENYIIIVDPDQSGDKTDGIFVVAKEVGEDMVTFKQLKYDGTKPYLNPLNPDYPKIFNKFRIIGKVIAVVSPKLP